MTDTKKTCQRLWYSLEMGVIWRNLILVLVIGVSFTFLYGLFNGGFGGHFWILAVLVFVLMVLPAALFCAIRTIRIYHKPDSYIFCRATLSKPRHFWKYKMYYTVVLEDPEDGSKFLADTHAIFHSHGVMQPTIEEYTNRTVTIAYNRETGMIVVIG